MLVTRSSERFGTTSFCGGLQIGLAFLKGLLHLMHLVQGQPFWVDNWPQDDGYPFTVLLVFPQDRVSIP